MGQRRECTLTGQSLDGNAVAARSDSLVSARATHLPITKAKPGP